VYRRIEEYLTARNEPERLELVRRALYLKVNRKLTGSSRTQSWQRRCWNAWPRMALGSAPTGPARQPQPVESPPGQRERRALVNELNYSYRFLTQFARNEQTASLINKRDLNVLGRRLYAAFERKAGKVEFINPGIAPDLAEDTLTLVHRRTKGTRASQWGLVQRQPGRPGMGALRPIKRSRDCSNC
jgi:adenylate cyclase class 1